MNRKKCLEDDCTVLGYLLQELDDIKNVLWESDSVGKIKNMIKIYDKIENRNLPPPLCIRYGQGCQNRLEYHQKLNE